MKSNRKNIIILSVLGLMLFVSSITAFFMMGLNSVVWPSSEEIKTTRINLEKTQTDLDVKIKELSAKRILRKNFILQSTNFWINSRDGQIESGLMSKIEAIAKSTGIKLNNFGNTKLSKVNEQFSYFDFTLDAQAPMEDLAKFMVEMYKSNPRFYWTRCLLRQYKPNDSKEIVLSGALRVVCIEDAKMAQKLIGEQPK